MPNATDQAHHRTCNLCEAMCGLVIHHDNGKIHSIKGDPDDPLSRGHICPKAIALQDLHEDPDRIRQPQRRTASGWETISWREAFDTIENRISDIRARYGKNAVAMYIGNPTAHHFDMVMMLPALLSALNSRNRFSATSIDQLPHMMASLMMFGNQVLLPVPDIDRCDFFLCLGANPGASNGSVMSGGDILGRLKAIRQRGGRVVTVDPRRTETAAIADTHLFIRPGNDVFLLLAMLQVIFSDKKANVGRLAPHIRNLDVLQACVRDYTPESVAPLTGIAAADIRQLARDFVAARSAVCYPRIGACAQSYGGLTLWLAYALNIVSGNLDRPGGYMFASPAIDLAGLADLGGQTGSWNRWTSRVRGLPEFAGELPVATLAEEMLTPGDGQIKALITLCGNPALSTPNGKQLEEALPGLEFMVAIDIYRNETSRFADIILPNCSPLEQGHYDLLHAVAVRNTVKYSPPLYKKPEGDTREGWDVMLELAIRLGTPPGMSRRMAEAGLIAARKLGYEGMLDLALRSGPYGQRIAPLDLLLHQLRASTVLDIGERLHRLNERRRSLFSRIPLLDRSLRVTPYGDSDNPLGQPLSMALLKQHPHGVDLGPLRSVLPARIAHRDRKIDLAPAPYVQDLSRARQQWQQAAADDSTLLLIGRRHVRSNNSWMHNSHRLVKGPNRCTLMMHSLDAAARGIEAGDEVCVRTRIGEVRLPVSISDDIMPGVVSMPHGFGHHRSGTALHIAQTEAPGVSFNDISDDRLTDPLTGMAIINGIPVEVRRVRRITSSEHAGSERQAVKHPVSSPDPAHT